jgi:hypothetical protein
MIFENCITNVIPLLYTDHHKVTKPSPVFIFAHNCKSMQKAALKLPIIGNNKTRGAGVLSLTLEEMIMDSPPPKKTSTHRALGIEKA